VGGGGVVGVWGGAVCRARAGRCAPLLYAFYDVQVISLQFPTSSLLVILVLIFLPMYPAVRCFFSGIRSAIAQLILHRA